MSHYKGRRAGTGEGQRAAVTRPGALRLSLPSLATSASAFSPATSAQAWRHSALQPPQPAACPPAPARLQYARAGAPQRQAGRRGPAGSEGQLGQERLLQLHPPGGTQQATSAGKQGQAAPAIRPPSPCQPSGRGTAYCPEGRAPPAHPHTRPPTQPPTWEALGEAEAAPARRLVTQRQAEVVDSCQRGASGEAPLAAPPIWQPHRCGQGGQQDEGGL